MHTVTVLKYNTQDQYVKLEMSCSSVRLVFDGTKTSHQLFCIQIHINKNLQHIKILAGNQSSIYHKIGMSYLRVGKSCHLSLYENLLKRQNDS